MMRRKYDTLELIGDFERSSSLRSSFMELTKSYTRSELHDFLSKFIEPVRRHPMIVRYTSKYFIAPKLVVFDLDSTLIQAEFMTQIGKAEVENRERREGLMKLTQEALNGDGNWEENYTARVALLKGMNVNLLKSYYKKLPLSDGAKELIAMFRYYEVPTVVVSGAWNRYVQHVVQLLNMDEGIGTEWEEENGLLTGKILDKPIGPSAKGLMLLDLATKYDVELEEIVVIADGYNDLQMLAEAGCSFILSTAQTPSPSFDPILASLKVDFLQTNTI